MRCAVCAAAKVESYFFKGDRCYKPSCAIEKRGTNPPGQHGERSPQDAAGYGEQLREKQKVKRIYFILESSSAITLKRRAARKALRARTCFSCSSAAWTTSSTASGFSTSRRQARQLVNHGHVTVNDRKVDIPSFQVKAGRRRSPSRTGSRKNRTSKARGRRRSAAAARPGSQRRSED